MEKERPVHWLHVYKTVSLLGALFLFFHALRSAFLSYSFGSRADYGPQAVGITNTLIGQQFALEALCYLFAAVFLLLTGILLRKKSRGTLWAVSLQAVCFPLLVILMSRLESGVNAAVLNGSQLEAANQTLSIRTAANAVTLFVPLLLNALYFRKRKAYFEPKV